MVVKYRVLLSERADIPCVRGLCGGMRAVGGRGRGGGVFFTWARSRIGSGLSAEGPPMCVTNPAQSMTNFFIGSLIQSGRFPFFFPFPFFGILDHRGRGAMFDRYK